MQEPSEVLGGVGVGVGGLHSNVSSVIVINHKTEQFKFSNTSLLIAVPSSALGTLN